MKISFSLWILLLGLFIGGCSTSRTETSPAAWNSLNSGMTRQELIQKLGQPSSRTAAGEDLWRQGKWELRVGYDERGQAVSMVRQLVLQ